MSPLFTYRSVRTDPYILEQICPAHRSARLGIISQVVSYGTGWACGADGEYMYTYTHKNTPIAWIKKVLVSVSFINGKMNHTLKITRFIFIFPICTVQQMVFFMQNKFSMVYMYTYINSTWVWSKLLKYLQAKSNGSAVLPLKIQCIAFDKYFFQLVQVPVLVNTAHFK